MSLGSGVLHYEGARDTRAVHRTSGGGQVATGGLQLPWSREWSRELATCSQLNLNDKAFAIVLIVSLYYVLFISWQI